MVFFSMSLFFFFFFLLKRLKCMNHEWILKDCCNNLYPSYGIVKTGISKGGSISRLCWFSRKFWTWKQVIQNRANQWLKLSAVKSIIQHNPQNLSLRSMLWDIMLKIIFWIQYFYVVNCVTDAVNIERALWSSVCVQWALQRQTRVLHCPCSLPELQSIKTKTKHLDWFTDRLLFSPWFTHAHSQVCVSHLN